MAIGFPLTPTVNLPHSYQGKNWTYTGNGWKKVNNGTTPVTEDSFYKTIIWGYKPPTNATETISTIQIEHT